MRPLLLLLPLVLPLPVTAGALSDLLMAPGLLAEAPVGSTLAYAEARQVPDGGTLEDVADGSVRIEVKADGDARALLLVRESGGAAQPVGTFAAGVANPLLLYFLETTVRATAEATGGSPYYIRNRIREALAGADLGDGGTAAGPREVTLVPFAADPNRPRMGDFADLTLRVRFDPAEPGRLLELSADTAGAADGYHEKMVLIGED